MSHTPAPASSEAGRETSRNTPEGSLTVGDVVALVEAAAPPGLAASWDSNGLICGDPADPVRSILLAVDPVAAVVDEAIDSDVDMIITHHPLYLRGTDHVAATDPKGRSIHRLIRAGIALLNAHTSLDAAHGGVAEALADRVGLTSASPLEPDPASPDQGIGRIGVLPHPITLRQLASDVAAALPDSAPGLLVGGDLDAVVERIAVSGGAGDSLLQPPTCATPPPPSTWRKVAPTFCAERTGPPSGSAWSPSPAGSRREPVPMGAHWRSRSPALSRTPGYCAWPPDQTGRERIMRGFAAPTCTHLKEHTP